MRSGRLRAAQEAGIKDPAGTVRKAVSYTHLDVYKRQVESVRHSRWNDLPYVTSKLLTFDEQQLLLEVIRGADWKHRDVITASPMLVQHLWLAGSVDEAVRLAETALQVAPSHLQLNYAYGIALGYAGRLDEAAAAFEKCLVIDPGYAAAHWSLAYTRKRAGTEVDRASRIEAASRREEKAQEKPFLHYACLLYTSRCV